MIALFSIVLEFSVIAVFVLLSRFVSIWFCVPGIIFGAGAALYLIYFWLAPNNIFFTFVKEGTAKVITKGGAISKILIQFSGRVLDERWNVIPGNPRKRLLGGLRFYGIWPISEVFKYKFSWTSRRQDGELSKHEKELLDQILLTPDVYFGEVKKAETKDLLPLGVKFLIGAKIINPYKTSYEIQDWLEAVMARVIKAITSALTEKDFQEWIDSNGQDLSRRICDDPQTQELMAEAPNLYGVKITLIEILEIDPGEEFRKITLSKYQGERETDKMVANTAEAVVKMMAAVSGITLDEMRAEIKKSRQKRKEYREWIIDMRAQKQALDSGGMKRFDFHGLPAEGSSSMAAAAVIADALSGKPTISKTEVEKKPGEKKSKEDEELEELDKDIEEWDEED
ncbi:MAG: hypothetical protein Q8N88_03440 [Nanoarchaeota archaeon]|nr:hypothetical protein [Nanoarchaeota archaeon]